MAISGTTSALVAAFAFGIVVNAASAALFLNVRGHGSSIFRDGKRLVLAIFLFSAATWAQVGFITTLIDPAAENSCQIAIVFTTMFDQLARYAIEQHSLWVINDGTPASTGQIIPQVFLAIRFVLGAVFVGLSRPQFNAVCVPVSSVLALAITLVVVDAVVVTVLAGRAISVGLIKKMQDGGQDSARSKAVVATLIGLIIWMATSVAMLLGIFTTDYIFRSTIPAGGLTILLIITTASTSAFADQKPRARDRNVPEAPSPRQIVTARSISTSDSNEYPPSRYEDVKNEQITSSTAFIQPREVPFPNQGLPSITNPGISGQGVGGVPVQGQLFPPMRAGTAPINPREARQPEQLQNKPRTLFSSAGAGGPAKTVTVGKLAISAPVLQQGGSNPLDKVATTDLDTAARKERERRALLVSQSQEPALRNQVAAAAIEPAQGVMRATSTLRKEIVRQPSLPALPDGATSATGFTTSSQLSPGGEELRRRSPRHAPSASQTSAQSVAVSSASSRPPSPPKKSAARAAPKGQDVVIRTDIPPSRQLPPSPEPAGPEPTKTPLQKRPTIGLPGNPRAMSVRRPPGESGPQRQQTVMFVNNIIYDDPNYVESVMGGAKERGPKAAVPPPINTAPADPTATPAIPETPGTSNSIVHRPRPVPRRSNTSGMDTYFPPIAPAKGHRKSKSAGSIRTVKSMLQAVPGSPTNLPPLPLPPSQQVPSYAARPKPNDTKSMTYDEKMTLLFPQPPNAEGSARRRSSVPSLPGMPVSFISSSPTLTDNLGYNNQYRDSKRTTTSVQTRSLFDEPEETSQREVSTEAPRDPPGAIMYQDLLSEAGQEVMAEEENLTDEKKQSLATARNGKRASSPVLPARFSIMSASTTDNTTADDATTEWGTVHSPAPVQQIGLTVHQARAIEVGKPEKASGQDQRAVSAITNSEEMIFMLDASVARDLQPKGKAPATLEEESPVVSRASSGQFYRRVGDETLSFSSRPDKARSRRGPPPVPLVLSDRPTTAKQAVLVKAAEPSPLPSPEEALMMIQAQLKKYEQPAPGAADSPGLGRLALLNDLEAEMGQQETRWHGMQHDLSRDSFSTVSPTAQSRRNSEAAPTSPAEALSRNSSTKSKESVAADRRASRRARMGSISSTRSSSRESDDGRNRASLWQRRLAEAQMEYMENANELIRKRSLNFLSVAKAGMGSPTPPDSDESEAEIESRRNLAALLEARARHHAEETERPAGSSQLLWTPRREPQPENGLMWVRPQRPYEQHLPRQEPPLPGLSVRPAQRKESSMLPIESAQLWQKSTSLGETSRAGLWVSPAGVQTLKELSQSPTAGRRQAPSYYNPGIQRSRSASGSRPLTQRPPRRSKRITALPDIVEDPQPLPDKRGTLGIFQFPWGEKSDIASVQTRPSVYMAMPGTMSAGGRSLNMALDARARQIESDEYSSSFFDDYDEDAEDGSDSSSDMGSDSDDGFDESTLWEIASLLKTDQIPSTNSMFPPPDDTTSHVIDDYADEEEAARVVRQTILVGIEEPDGLQEMPSPLTRLGSPKRTQSALWQATRGTERALSAKGLPQPEDWQNYDAPTETSRAKPRMPVQPAPIESDNLWLPSQVEAIDSKSPMWSLPSSVESSQPVSPKDFSEVLSSQELSTELSRSLAITEPLWKAEQQPQKGDHGVGLPHPDNWEALDNTRSTVRTKPRHSEPGVIESDNLWQTASGSRLSKNWLEAPAPIAPTRPLWEAVEKPTRGEHNIGLPHPDNWDEYDGAKQTLRSKPRQSGPAVVESVNLWQAPSSEQPGPRNWLKLPRAITTSHSLWRVNVRPRRGEHSVGLPQPQSWDSYNTIASTIRAKPRQSSPATIESVDLWKVSSTSESASRNWLKPASRPLWQAAALAKKGDHTVGLPQPRSWTSYDSIKTTARAKPRQSEPAAIESADLWQAPSAQEATPTSKLWAPRMLSAPVTRTASPVSDTFNQFDATKLLWSAPVSPKLLADSGLFNPSISRLDFRRSSQIPAAADMSRKPRPADRRPVDKLNSTTLWVADAAPQNERNWISPMPSPKGKTQRAPAPVSGSHTPAKSQPRPVAASSMDWDAALRQALAASYPMPSRRAVTTQQWDSELDKAVAASYPASVTSSRRTVFRASAADWDNALAEAVSQSYGNPFDVTKRHPVFAAASLTSSAMIAHPAATGYTHSVASVHPVFFGSGVFACPADNTHPAINRPWPSNDSEPSRGIETQSTDLAPTYAGRVLDEDEHERESEMMMDSALLARIEALEQERLFAERWARGSFAPVDVTPKPPQATLDPPAEETQGVPEQTFDFDFEPVDVTPAVPLATLTLSPITQTQAEAPTGSVLDTPVSQRLRRAETFQSVSEMSEVESSVVRLRDSLVSVGTPKEMKPAGSSIKFIY
ncbi:hypothetical protein KVR01_012539 [Diaporthe batatas]|uniref:uncharacterized protein n=1 Tax=Diaporthe batatas TaxID=748121 RepID=UPI001D0413D1|nr:uncharacterized protein KVR01_012539 [Diaporthe batatas]KAG8157497.1 hypothetical protein KVR01_012539 [Diaporthe batatas]